MVSHQKMKHNMIKNINIYGCGCGGSKPISKPKK